MFLFFLSSMIFAAMLYRTFRLAAWVARELVGFDASGGRRGELTRGEHLVMSAIFVGPLVVAMWTTSTVVDAFRQLEQFDETQLDEDWGIDPSAAPDQNPMV